MQRSAIMIKLLILIAYSAVIYWLGYQDGRLTSQRTRDKRQSRSPAFDNFSYSVNLSGTPTMTSAGLAEASVATQPSAPSVTRLDVRQETNLPDNQTQRLVSLPPAEPLNAAPLPPILPDDARPAGRRLTIRVPLVPRDSLDLPEPTQETAIADLASVSPVSAPLASRPAGDGDSTTTEARADKIRRKNPAFARKVANGEIKEADALRVLMKDLAAEQLEYDKYRRPGSGSLTG
jgi:hypothetical protein